MLLPRIEQHLWCIVCIITLSGNFVGCFGQSLEHNMTDLLWHKLQGLTDNVNGNVTLKRTSFLERFTCHGDEHDCAKCVSSRSTEVFTESNFMFQSMTWIYDVLCEHAVLVCEDDCIERHFQQKLSRNGVLVPSKGAEVLSSLKLLYKPSSNSECFHWYQLSHDLLPEQTDKNEAVNVNFAKYFMTDMFIRLYKGECILPTLPDDYVFEIFSNYGSSEKMTRHGLNNLMRDIGIIRSFDPDHEDAGEHSHDHDHAHDDHALYHHHIQYHDPHDHDHDHDHDPDKDSELIEVSLLARNHGPSPQLEEYRSDPGIGRPTRSKRHAEEADGHDHDHGEENVVPLETKNISKQCLTADELLKQFNEDSSGNLTRSEFQNLASALIHQHLQTTCVPEKAPKAERNDLEVYGYGTLAVFVISLCSVLGVVLMPIQNSSLYQYIMMCFIALAFGTLTGDALLHLIPESMGIHLHDEGNGMPPMFWKFIALLGAVYGLFVFEGLADLAVHGIRKKENADGGGGHGHSHIPEIDLVRMVTKGENKSMSQETLASKEGNPASSNGELNTTPHEPHKLIEGQTTVCFGMTTLALVIIVGDAIHNVADGLTIGAAFASSTKGGLSSTLAILFHELPHEFGDFVILLSTGFSYKKALAWNFISSLTAFIGLYVGISLGESPEARQWILIIAAGMFLYIAVGDMLPELKNQKGDNGLVAFIVQNIGALVGMIFMILMGVFESKIKIS